MCSLLPSVPGALAATRIEARLRRDPRSALCPEEYRAVSSERRRPEGLLVPAFYPPPTAFTQLLQAIATGQP